jgi:outer membrane protein assembly factor BamB
MKITRFLPSARLRQGAAIVLSAIALAACSSGSKPKPAELPANPQQIGLSQAWSFKLPEIEFPLVTDVSGDVAVVAGGEKGTVVAIDARVGKELWRVDVGAALSAGVGSDGTLSAVVTRDNELVAIQGGEVLWRKKLSAETFTPPLVAGRRIFVQGADRVTTAWDGQSGRRLWSQTRTAEALVLKRPGVLQAVNDALVTGVGARLVAMNPANGASVWEAPIASPRGTNDVERLVDLTGSISVAGSTICARAYYAAVGCVDASRGALLWTKPTTGSEGVSGDDNTLYGTEQNGVVTAWRRRDGEQLWTSDAFKYRELTAPLAAGRTLIIGEGSGNLLLLDRADGKLLARVSPDGSAIAADPVVVADTLVVVTAKGGVFGFRPK